MVYFQKRPLSSAVLSIVEYLFHRRISAKGEFIANYGAFCHTSANKAISVDIIFTTTLNNTFKTNRQFNSLRSRLTDSIRVTFRDIQ